MVPRNRCGGANAATWANTKPAALGGRIQALLKAGGLNVWELAHCQPGASANIIILRAMTRDP